MFWAKCLKLFVKKLMAHIYQTSKFHRKSPITTVVIELYFCKLFLMYLLTVVLPLRRRNHHYLGGSSSVQVSSVLSQLTRIRQVVVVKVELGNNLFYNAESL